MSAYMEGRKAHTRGKGLNDNPYTDSSTISHKDWTKGWSEVETAKQKRLARNAKLKYRVIL